MNHNEGTHLEHFVFLNQKRFDNSFFPQNIFKQNTNIIIKINIIKPQSNRKEKGCKHYINHFNTT